MTWAFIGLVGATVSSSLLLAACSDKPADAGLVGADRVTAITWNGAASIEPFFAPKITIDHLDRATLSIENSEGPLPKKFVKTSRGSFESIALDLAEFRRVEGNLTSNCRGHTDTGQVVISWHYASGHVGSYAVNPGCHEDYERRFVETARSIPRRTGLESAIDNAPAPEN